MREPETAAPEIPGVTRDGTVVDPKGFETFVGLYPDELLGREMSLALAEAGESSQIHGAKSTVTLKIEVQPGVEGRDLVIKCDVASKLAKAPADVRHWFPGVDGVLTRNDPDSLPGF